MRSRGAVAFSLGFCLLGLRAGQARAADCSGVVSTCINDDTLWPHPGAARFIAVGSTETVATGQLGFGLVATYLSRPIMFRVAAPGAGAGGSDQYAVNDQVNGTFLWAYGVTRRLELDLALPLTFGQGGTGLSPISGGAGLKDTAVRDLRFGFAYSFLPRDPGDPDDAAGAGGARTSAWGLAARFETSAPIGDSDQFAGERAAVFVPTVAASFRGGRFFAGAEFGARVRPIAELLNARIGTQLYAAAGVGYDFLPHGLLGATLEGWALPTLTAQEDVVIQNGAYVGLPNGQHIVPAEWQLAARSSPLRGGDLSIQLGGGTGIPLSGTLPTTTPRFRFTLALRWAVH